MYAEAMVAVYRFMGMEEALIMFDHCMEPERSDAAKTAGIRAALTICQDVARFPWQKSPTDLITQLAPRVRDVLRVRQRDTDAIISSHLLHRLRECEESRRVKARH